ncbi:MAG: SiaB family protein kinase [Bacteroidales bacterium]|nr:SiaB family protein kinase [Bacteroidales bacterium]
MDQSLDFIYKRFCDIEKDDLEYVYRGEITPRLVMDILDMAKANLAKADDTRKMRSRIYYIMGEGLQNITRHQADSQDKDNDQSAIIVIHKKKHKYIIATGNLMLRADEEPLRKKLEKINHLDSEGLKEFSRETRTTTGLSEKGGASLGLIEMAKRSGNKLDYMIKPVDDQFSYFYLTTEIKISECPEDGCGDNYAIPDLVDVHENFNANNYNLSFKGDFNQENLLALLSILKSGMDETPTRIKLYGVMVELLQNIVKHADNIDDNTDWKAGVFYICEQDDKFSLLAGNYIDHKYSQSLCDRIKRLNAMDYKELSKEYNKILFNFNNDRISTGLGFIDIRRKTGTQIEYSVKEVNPEKDFVMVKVDINKIN